MARAGEAPPPLRIGFVGSGCIARFHVKSFLSVRYAQITRGFTPTSANRDAMARGRTLTEAREMLALAEDAELAHGYLENQVFASAVERGKEIIWRRAAPLAGRPYLARAAEEHSGPHEPWFWQGDKQGGGVMS